MAIVYSFVTDQLKKAFEIMQNFTVYGTLSLFDLSVCLIVIHLVVTLFVPLVKSNRRDKSD